ncbi:MAG TPA: hypothetical protein DDW30_06425 [Clostridiales bacterium]|nr:hypothetical protein [Clostridiales bacterium]
MKNKLIGRLLSVFLCGAMLFGFAGCGGCNSAKENGKAYDNETDPLVFSTLEVDKVFNPFFSTSATDSNVVGMTQISMLGNDKNGSYTYGDAYSVVTKDLQITTTGTPDVDQKTTYLFVLKNNVKFSNGSPLTMKDVLFNLYVYLDPVYTGSSTIYSTDIVGLKEYRTQESDENEQKTFMQQFEIKASARIDALVGAAEELLEEQPELTADAFAAALRAYATKNGSSYAYIEQDYLKATELFREELENDYSNALNSYQDIKFYDEDKTEYTGLIGSDVEAFLYNEGYITWSKKDKKLTYACGESNAKSWSKEQAIDFVFNANIPDGIGTVVKYWGTATELHTYITNLEMEEYFRTATLKYPNISGITFANREQAVTVNGTSYAVPTYGADGAVTSGNEVLSITINGVDPKAIWNFAFAVAPMYYYSDEEHIQKFDYVSNFGVERGSTTFMEKVVKNPDKIGVPVGAGPYAASKSSGGITDIKAGDFYSLGLIYFERNPYYLMGPAKIKKVRFQVVSSAQMLNSLYNKEIDFAEPNAKPETITELDGKKADGIGNTSIETSGYGYIGINAGKVPDRKVRQAIMHSINTQECVDYYKTTAKAIYRSMSRANWAYPEKATAYYPYIGGKVPENLDVVNPDYKAFCLKKGKKAGDTFTREEQQEFIRGLVEDAGYQLNGDGIYQKGNSVLRYTFTVAGETTDHPAWMAMWHAGEVLNQVGFQITVSTDANALKKLSTGDLTVWAAAWGSTIDPDMYQVYHVDSTATSTLNWGYKQIKLNNGGKYDEELALVEQLSELIDQGRRTTDQNKRKAIYEKALTIVMELAIELPTYQRNDLFAYNTDKIDVSTLTPESELSSYKGLTSELDKVSLVTENTER